MHCIHISDKLTNLSLVYDKKFALEQTLEVSDADVWIKAQQFLLFFSGHEFYWRVYSQLANHIFPQRHSGTSTLCITSQPLPAAVPTVTELEGFWSSWGFIHKANKLHAVLASFWTKPINTCTLINVPHISYVFNILFMCFNIVNKAYLKPIKTHIIKCFPVNKNNLYTRKNIRLSLCSCLQISCVNLLNEYFRWNIKENEGKTPTLYCLSHVGNVCFFL